MAPLIIIIITVYYYIFFKICLPNTTTTNLNSSVTEYHSLQVSLCSLLALHVISSHTGDTPNFPICPRILMTESFIPTFAAVVATPILKLAAVHCILNHWLSPPSNRLAMPLPVYLSWGGSCLETEIAVLAWSPLLQVADHCCHWADIWTSLPQKQGYALPEWVSLWLLDWHL